MESPLALAVDIRNAEKCYGTKPVFTNLSMHVPRGKIYALLGPSGCGKTTLLRCILGRLKPDKGSVLLFGYSLGSKESEIPGPAVGYMAQETTVYSTMTIVEYLRYFGIILGVMSDQILPKIEYFIELLRLPHKNTLNSKLSGGQLKRVQFAAALIHDPKLLILDEPTVGIDVIGKRRMWEHLVKLTVNKGTTIIITTHYIEEARLADRVGLMHGCTMAAEDTIQNLLRNHDESTLEGVFLKICSNNYNGDVVVVNNEFGTDVTNGNISHQPPNTNKNSGIQLLGSNGVDRFTQKVHRKTLCDRYGFNIAWHRLYSIMIRHFIGLYRFPGVLILLALIPSHQVFMFIQTMGHLSGGIPMIIVNDDTGHLGAQYLSQLNPDIVVQKPYHDYNGGFQALLRGESHGILRIRSNFSAVFYKRFSQFALSNEEMVKAGTIDVQMDNTYLNTAKFAELHMLNVFELFTHEAFIMAGINPLFGQLPINVSKRTVQVLSRPPSIYILSGQAVMASFFASLPIVLIGIFMDKHKGYMEPNLIAGVNAAETFLGTLSVQLVVLVFQDIGIMLSALPVLLEFNNGSLFLIFCLLYVQGICGASLGILLSLLCDQIPMMFAIVSNIIFTTATTSGSIWPIEAMPVAFRYLSLCFPSTLSCRAMEHIIHQGWDLRYAVVWGAFGISFFWIFVFVAASFLVFYRKT